jgi:hypothetical protein
MRTCLAVVLFCLAAPLALPGAALATDPRFDRGSWEVGIELNPNVGLEPSIGYFVLDNFSVSLHIAGHGIAYENPAAPDDEVSNGELRLDGTVNVPTSGALVPFFGLGLSSFNQKVKTAGVTTIDLEGGEVHGLIGLRFLAGQIGSVNLLLRAGRASVDNNLTRASQDSAFADLALAYSLFF